ncbi:AimR family lysis-lysogeny pheromone receptor [Bacillus thuringiensis]|uniref:AimR family lysis-lysogeny pheromone receptor n=1 Tax=Bacillus cereus group TaxID=86661 RepID=UPI0029C2BB83|nr:MULTISPECIES: AimR family lysis-lysogeny pheromone receptor [Bacillus cereus group]MDX5769677.1 AimR family lysis-lysogeny pheromone receptor [Bacillus cereus group sp. BfR-BA-02675]MEC3224803.1 AimR family lysis-lysogeny pheromone receptor [Bacillus thuringiensis]MEC3554962.1 AimR family lysis-lysogeny pheromone receptor [Bacillus thuringiensis]MED2058301.1 AimR family lysis-lysogeny pheromone receptor [Bacillus thuringiensis]
MDQKVKKEDVPKKNTLVGFLKVLVDDIDFQKRSQEDLAKEIGISGGTFSKNLTGKSQFSFWNLIKLLNILYENDINKKRQMLFTFCSVTTSKKNVRIAMEYANAKGDLQLLKSLVDSEKKSSLAMNREWAYVYELVWLRSSGSIEKQKLLAKIEDRKGSKVIKTKEMKVLYGILTYYTMYDLKKYNSLFEYAGVLVPEVEAITDNFIKSSYLGRIKEGLAYAYLVQDNLEKSRSLCHEILDIENIEGCFHLLRASAFVYLAESYTFECYDSASRYIKESLKQLEPYYFEREKYRRQRILNTYAFIKLVNKKNLENIKIYHCAEKSLLEIVKGNYINAVNILNDLEKENGYLTPMQYCYLGIAKDDISLIEKSIMLFECEGDRFYCKFPKKIMAEFNKNGMIC